MILAANHASHLDTGLLLSSLPVALRHHTIVAAAADYFFDRHWKAAFWSFGLGAIPMERSKVNRRSADLAASLIERRLEPHHLSRGGPHRRRLGPRVQGGRFLPRQAMRRPGDTGAHPGHSGCARKEQLALSARVHRDPPRRRAHRHANMRTRASSQRASSRPLRPSPTRLSRTGGPPAAAPRPGRLRRFEVRRPRPGAANGRCRTRRARTSARPASTASANHGAAMTDPPPLSPPRWAAPGRAARALEPRSPCACRLSQPLCPAAGPALRSATRSSLPSPRCPATDVVLETNLQTAVEGGRVQTGLSGSGGGVTTNGAPTTPGVVSVASAAGRRRLHRLQPGRPALPWDLRPRARRGVTPFSARPRPAPMTSGSGRRRRSTARPARSRPRPPCRRDGPQAIPPRAGRASEPGPARPGSLGSATRRRRHRAPGRADHVAPATNQAPTPLDRAIGGVGDALHLEDAFATAGPQQLALGLVCR